jgi:hypothetical protein
MKILVICCEGASGSSLSAEDQIFGIAKSILPSSCRFVQIEHTLNIWKFRKSMCRALETPSDAVIVIGKSQGADRAITWLNGHPARLSGESIALISIDPHHWLIDTARDRLGLDARVRTLDHVCIYSDNIYQTLHTPTGYRVDGAQNICVEADHWTIPHHEVVRKSIQEAYRQITIAAEYASARRAKQARRLAETIRDLAAEISKS